MTPQNLGVLPHPDGRSASTGTCGDSMELTLRVDDGVIVECLFMPEGCIHTLACGSAVTEMAKGIKLSEALKIGPEEIIEVLEGLPSEYHHCAELAAQAMRTAVKDCLSRGPDDWKRLYRKP